MTGIMPLDDVRVVDLTRYTAGPFCTRMLADYGADVVKIEQPGSGDPARGLPPFYRDEPGLERSGLFLMLNTGKRSVTLDLRSERGRELVLELARGAQVLVENFRPGTMERLGLGWERLHELNPQLVVTSISNFGQSGPYRDYRATDLTLFGMGGNMIASGDVDYEPVKTAGHATTHHAGYVAALATATGLLSAELRGVGDHLDISIFESAVHSIDGRQGRIMGYQYNGRMVGRAGRESSVGSGTYPCADGYFTLTVGPAFLARAMRMIGREELLEQPEWSSVEALAHPDRVAEFDALLLPWTLERTRQQLRAECERFGVLAGPLNTVEDLLRDENFVARGFFHSIDHPTTGPIAYPGYHFTLHREHEPMPPRRRAPLLGEHTDEVLGELGVDAAELSQLRAAQLV